MIVQKERLSDIIASEKNEGMAMVELAAMVRGRIEAKINEIIKEENK